MFGFIRTDRQLDRQTDRQTRIMLKQCSLPAAVEHCRQLRNDEKEMSREIMQLKAEFERLDLSVK